MYSKYRNIVIKGISAAVPKTVYDNAVDNDFFSAKEAESIIKLTGIAKRRIAPSSMCASDLCFEAADNLLTQMAINRNEVNMLILISQMPDYKCPATSIILQDRLGLPTSTAAFDINLGCSGFVYGLSIAYAFAAQPHIHNVLLLNGETRSRAFSYKDKSAGLLFGDGGSACLIGKQKEDAESCFSLNSDGSRFDYIIIKSGGYRYPSNSSSLEEKEYPDGSIRNDEHAVMKGEGIFEFAITDVFKNIKETMEHTSENIETIDLFIFHQANKFITDHIAKKLKIPIDKVPYSLDRFGNISSVSIPLTMVTEVANLIKLSKKRILLSGFGIGLSWATAIIDLDKPYVSKLIEV